MNLIPPPPSKLIFKIENTHTASQKSTANTSTPSTANPAQSLDFTQYCHKRFQEIIKEQPELLKSKQ
jgi:hypothetical protein